MEARYNLWIENRKAVVVSQWRADLLRAVEKAGSVAGGAKAMKVSERTARQKVREMEAGLRAKLLEPVPGAGRSARRLTARGREVLERFERFSAGFQEEVARRYAAEFGG
jgi:molybdate transport system regulatory protein